MLFTAAHNPSGKAALLIELAVRGTWRLATSTFAIEEARRNLEKKAPGAVERLATVVDAMKVIASGSGAFCPVPLPDKDRPILEAAIACRATHLLTGDHRHFGEFMNRPESTAGILVQRVADFLS